MCSVRQSQGRSFGTLPLHSSLQAGSLSRKPQRYRSTCSLGSSSLTHGVPVFLLPRYNQNLSQDCKMETSQGLSYFFPIPQGLLSCVACCPVSWKCLFHICLSLLLFMILKQIWPFLLHLYGKEKIPFKLEIGWCMTLHRWLSGKESACNAGDLGLIAGSGRSPGEGNGNPFQYSCLENSMDREAWQTTVHGVVKSQTWLSN